jgi:predicted house-cleaning NTP pyrophosphatase (Maf/HAM1 superfamily)
MELILGSQSPRRRELLERMGLRFRVLTADIDETKFETEDPEASVRRICREKAAAVAQAVGSDPLIAPVIAGGNDAAVPAAEASGDASLRVGGPTAQKSGRALLRAPWGFYGVFTAGRRS